MTTHRLERYSQPNIYGRGVWDWRARAKGTTVRERQAMSMANRRQAPSLPAVSILRKDEAARERLEE